MKRIVICAAIMLCAVLLSAYSGYAIKEAEREINVRLDAFAQPLAAKDKEELARLADDLERFWDQKESVLIHFVRHSNLDPVTLSAARMPWLARHGEFGEFSAEASSIRRYMEHISDNERLSFATIF